MALAIGIGVVLIGGASATGSLALIAQERDQFQEQWLDAYDNLLQWQLRALEAEKQGTRLPYPS
jgi:hypothetical protein